MDDLTARELRFYNLMSFKVNLGTKLQEIIDSLQVLSAAGTPVNAVNATKVLTISGVVVDGETVTINNPAVSGSDVYEFLGDVAQTKTAPGNIAVNINALMTKSTGTLTIATQPTSGDTMTIGEKVYTFVPVGTNNADGEIPIGTNVASARLAIVAAINGTDLVNDPHPLVTASAFTVANCTLTALIGGVIGDAIPTTETFTAEGNVFVAVTLGSGADCTATNAVTALVAAITAHDTQGVEAVDGAGDTVELTADTAGVLGNAIILAETMAHGAFAGGAVKMSGGVDGTVAPVGSIKVDASYLYIAIDDNTVSGKNWRRISVGSAY